MDLSNYDIKKLTKQHVQHIMKIDDRAIKYFNKQNIKIKPSIIHYKNNQYYVLKNLMN